MSRKRLDFKALLMAMLLALTLTVSTAAPTVVHAEECDSTASGGC